MISAGGGSSTVEVADSTCITLAGDGSASAPLTATPVIDPDPGNQLQCGPAGLMVPAAVPAPVEVADGTCITLTGDGTAGDALTAAPVLDPDPGNQLQCGPTGLLVPAAAEVTCDDVRPCISAGPGAAYDPATGVVTAHLSTDAGNTLVVGGDDGLFVPAAAGSTVVVADGTCISLTGDGTAGDPLTAAPVLDPVAGNQLQCGPDGLVVPAAAGLEVGPGLTGTGVVGDPVEAAVNAWPYACDLDDNAGLVYADSAGRLRSEQRGGIVRYVSFFEERYYNNLTVPAGFDQPGANFETTITNPDPCHEALVVVIREADVDFNLPAGAGAAYGNGSDEMFYFRNSGSSTSTDIHTQTVKQFHNAVPLGPGASEVIPFDVTLGRGSGGATYNRIQINIRCLIISLPVVL
ncbi:hypothetical protein [Streptomyces sp. PA03-2a]|uniref:hypothetical protein n=1 Tax=Streptomyces sp. PA03-2a TaxID=3028701 RepID=UPI0029B562F4|nr:hypothetical protein [Streptomyces sp. PA03-2a]MDX2731017.1 hypothetical protein [Streptomyces sp. PA03-2a]